LLAGDDFVEVLGTSGNVLIVKILHR
jgi:hypothetical protein